MKHLSTILFCILLLLSGSCSKWTETEALEQPVIRPQAQDPELWARYTALLREYKASEHFIVYARLENSPKVATSEKDFMRCLPDSLDFVSLTNADNFSQYDAEDLPIMKEKGTKVLYQIDYASRSATDLTDNEKLSAYLDRVTEFVRLNGLDGWSFTGIPDYASGTHAAAASLIVSRLSAAKAEGQYIVFEGNPIFLMDLEETLASSVDYVVLDSDRTYNITELKMQVANALDYAGIPEERLLIAAAAGSPFTDADGTEYAAVAGMTEQVAALGPLAGLAVYNVGADYYGLDRNYSALRRSIQVLNPSI